MKKCGMCNTQKETTEYNKQTKTKDGLQHYCRRCCKYYKAKLRYNLEKEDYDILLKTPACIICNVIMTNEASKSNMRVIDHCHDTSKIRGIICNHCNTGLGLFKDNIEVLSNAIDYLKHYK